MLDYIDAECKAWGRCSRWMLTDTNEGYPSADTIEKARQGMLSMGSGSRLGQHFREVRTGGALEIARAMAGEPRMPLVLTATIWAQYVVPGCARQKLPGLSRYLGLPISLSEFWRNVDRAHHFLAGRIGSRS